MEQHAAMGMSWKRFAAMIGASVLLMFILMYQLVYTPAHVMFAG